jgi:hypothetical protein
MFDNSLHIISPTLFLKPKFHKARYWNGKFDNLTLVQNWGAIHSPKSLWDIKSEIGLLHLNDFTLVKVISL